MTEFKPGDKVRITGRAFRDAFWPKEGVLAVNAGIFPWRVVFDGDKAKLVALVAEDEIELIKETKLVKQHPVRITQDIAEVISASLGAMNELAGSVNTERYSFDLDVKYGGESFATVRYNLGAYEFVMNNV